jgi:hypothetical protein
MAVDLSGYGPVSIMLLQLDTTKDCESTRMMAHKPTGGREITEEEAAWRWSFDYQILTGILGREHTKAKKKGKNIDVDFSTIVAHVIAVEPIGDGLLALYWQSHDQAAQNPRLEVAEIAEPVYRTMEPMVSVAAPDGSRKTRTGFTAGDE